MAVTPLVGDRGTAWAAHLRGLGVPKQESERAFLLAAGETAGGLDLTTMLSRLLAQGNGVRSAEPEPSPLLTNLVSYWSFDAGWNDVHGTNHLTNVNGVTAVAGKLGQAGDFEASSTQSLSHPDPNPLGNEDWTYSLWLKCETTTDYMTLIAKDDAATNRAYVVYFDRDTGRINFDYLARGIAAISTPMSDLNWHWVVLWHDAVTRQVSIQIDAGTVITSNASGIYTPPALNVEVRLSGRPAVGQYFDGLIDEVGLWRRLLTAGERTALYNSGNGLAYPFA